MFFLTLNLQKAVFRNFLALKQHVALLCLASVALAYVWQHACSRKVFGAFGDAWRRDVLLVL